MTIIKSLNSYYGFLNKLMPYYLVIDLTKFENYGYYHATKRGFERN